MTQKTPAKIDIDLVRRELGIKVAFERPLTRSLTMVGLGVLFSWTVIYIVMGEETFGQVLRSVGLLR